MIKGEAAALSEAVSGIHYGGNRPQDYTVNKKVSNDRNLAKKEVAGWRPYSAMPPGSTTPDANLVPPDREHHSGPLE